MCGDSKYLYVNAQDDTVVIDMGPVVLAAGLAITIRLDQVIYIKHLKLFKTGGQYPTRIYFSVTFELYYLIHFSR